MHTVFIVRVLVCRHISGRCIDQLRDPVDDGSAGHFHRCRSVYGNRRLRLTDEGPVIPVEFIRCKSCMKCTKPILSTENKNEKRNESSSPFIGYLLCQRSPKNDFCPSKKALTYKGGSNDRQMNPPSTLLFHLFSSSDSLL